MTQYHPELEALKNRFVTFTNKLLEKANELEIEAKTAAQLVYDEDPDRYKRTYGQFKLGIEGQFKGLVNKLTEVFDQQIMPLRTNAKYSDRNLWFSDVQNVWKSFEDIIRNKARNVFADVELISNEFYLQEILEEYDAIKNAFNCQQCGANLNIDQMYFVSTYITCPFCKTKNTFIPGTRMKELEGIARDLAEERLKSLKESRATKEYLNDSKHNKTIDYIFYRAYVWVEKRKIVPIYSNSYLKVFLREMHDDLSGLPSATLKLQTELYQILLNCLGFVSQMKPKIVAAYEMGDADTVKVLLTDWEMLFHLSSTSVTYLYQGVEHQDIHEEHFQRIQNQWTLISSINKLLYSREIDVQEAIKRINLNIN